PPEVAAFLDRPHVTSAVGLALEGDRLRVRRETDDGEETVEVPLPAVVSVARAEREPAEVEPGNGRIDVWAADDLVDDVRENDKRFGQTGSPTRVLAVRDVTPQRAQIKAGGVEEAAEAARRLLVERPAPDVSWDKPPDLADDPAATYACWTLVELAEGMPTRHSLELVARGRELAGKLGGKNVALVAGHDVTAAATELARRGAEVVFDVDDALL